MKVLKMPDTNWTYKHTCEKCTAELEVEKSDVIHKSYLGDPREPGYETWQATCPVCNSVINVPINSIPKPVQLEISRGKLNTKS